MIVAIDAAGAIVLADAEEMRRFSIRMADTPPAHTALAGVARLDGADHAWLMPAWVASLAADATAEWRARFDAMVAYAATKNWTDKDGALRAHIDYDRTQ